jgi:hypothetical protein
MSGGCQIARILDDWVTSEYSFLGNHRVICCVRDLNSVCSVNTAWELSSSDCDFCGGWLEGPRVLQSMLFTVIFMVTYFKLII